MNITLSQKQHLFLVAFMPNKGNPECIKYVLQVAQGTAIYEPEKPLTVDVSFTIIRDCYIVLGQHPERLTARMNADIKTALMPQLQQEHIDELLYITSETHKELEHWMNKAKDFLASIR